MHAFAGFQWFPLLITVLECVNCVQEVERGVDSAFRLYRADYLLQMQLATRMVAATGFCQESKAMRMNAPVLFQNASMRMLYTKRRLPQVIMDFDCPPFLRRLSFEDRVCTHTLCAPECMGITTLPTSTPESFMLPGQ